MEKKWGTKSWSNLIKVVENTVNFTGPNTEFNTLIKRAVNPFKTKWYTNSQINSYLALLKGKKSPT